MCSEDLTRADLSPNYDLEWKDVLGRLIRFLLSDATFVKVSEHSETAMIRCKGRAFGQVSSVESETARANTQIITIERHGSQSSWSLEASAAAIQKSDIFCLLQGALKPSIIRVCRDHFEIILITATMGHRDFYDKYHEKTAFVRKVSKERHYPRVFVLVWNWDSDPGKSEGLDETLIDLTASDNSNSVLCGALERLTTVGLILADLRLYKGAESRLRQAFEGYVMTLGKEHAHTLIAVDTLADMILRNCKPTAVNGLSLEAKQKRKRTQEEKLAAAEALFLEVIEIRTRTQGENHPDTLRSMTSLAATYEEQRCPKQAAEWRTRIQRITRETHGPESEDKVVTDIAEDCSSSDFEDFYELGLRPVGPGPRGRQVYSSDSDSLS